MANLAETVSRLCQDYLIRPESEAGDYAERAILQAVEHYAPMRLGFNEAAFGLTLSATDIYGLDLIVANAVVTNTHWGLVDNWTGLGRPPYSIVTTQYAFLDSILAIDQVVVNDADYRYNLRACTLEEITDRRNGQRTSGKPAAYCIYDKSIWLDCPSSTSLSAHVYCHVKFADITADQTTESPWLIDGQQLVLARAAGQIFRSRLKDYEAASAMGALEQEELKSLRDRSRLLQSVGRLKGSW